MGDEVLERYAATDKVKKMMDDIAKGDKLPPIQIYEGIFTVTGLYVIADGIHRFVAHLSLYFTEIEIEFTKAIKWG